MISDPKLRARTLCIAARILHNRRQKEDAKEALRQALDAAQMARGEDERWMAVPDWQREVESEETLSGILVRIIDTMGDLGDAAGLKRALTILRDLEFRGARYRPKSELFVAIAGSLVRAGDLRSAIEVAELTAKSAELEVAGRREPGIEDKTRVLVAIAEELVNTGDNEEARRVLDRVWPALGGDDWALIVSGLAKIATWNRDFEDAQRLADRIDPRYPRERALAWLAEGMINARLEGATEKALEIAQDLTWPEFKTAVLLSVVRARARTGDVKDLLDLLPWAEELDDADMERSRSRFLRWLVHHLAHKGAWEKVQQIVDQIENRYWRGCALVDIAETAHRCGLTDLASHSLEKAATGLPVGKLTLWITDELRRRIFLRCFVASAWAPIDREHGLAIMSAQGLLAPPENLDSLEESKLLGICSPVSRALADLGEFDKAAQWAELAGSDRAEGLVHLGRSLLGAGHADRAISVLLRAAEEAKIARQSSRRPRFSPYDFTEPSPSDRTIWTYVDAVRLVLQESGPAYFMVCLEIANVAGESLSDQAYRVQLFARLEYLAEEMGWSELASLVRSKIAEGIKALIPSLDVIEEEGKLGPSLRKKHFWLHVLGAWPPRWIVHRYTEFSDGEIAERLQNVDRLVREWLSQEGISVEKIESSSQRVLDELEKGVYTFNLSIYDRNEIACALADRFARFRHYEAALQAAGLARITESQLESNRSNIDPITLARLALVSGRLGDLATCRDCLSYVFEYVPEITRAELFAPMSEAFVYAAKAVACLGNQELANELRDHLRGLLRDWLQFKRDDDMYHGALSVHYTGAFRHVVSSLAVLGDIEGLRLALEFARQVFWANDQSVCVAAVARAMATARDSEGLRLVFDVARSFAPQKPQFWIQHWSEIVQALLDAQFEVGNHQGVADIARWLLFSEPGEGLYFPGYAEKFREPWLARLLAYASYLLAEAEPQEYGEFIQQVMGEIADLEITAKQDEADIWKDRETGREEFILAYLDLAKAFANLQRHEQAAQMLRRAHTLIQQRGDSRLWRHTPLRMYALSELMEALASCDGIDKAISLIPDLTDEQLRFSVIYEIAAHQMKEGDLSGVDELLTEYPRDSETWQIYWRLYRRIAEARLRKAVTADWVDGLLKECASIDSLSTRSELCAMAADLALAHGDGDGARLFVGHVLQTVEQCDSLGSEELRALVPLVELIVRLNDVGLLHRVVSLAIADNYSALTKLAGDRRQIVQQLTRLLMEQLVQAMVELQDSQGLNQILNTVGDIGLEEAHEYYPFRSYRHRLDPRMLQLYTLAQHMEGIFDIAMRFRYEMVVLLAKAFGKLGCIADLHQLSRIPVRVSLSDEFIYEVGAYGSIGCELFRLQGEKGIADVLEAAEDVPEVWQPVLFANLAWAVHNTDAGAPVCSELIEKAVSAIDAAIAFVERAEPSEPGFFGRLSVDRGPIWAAVSKSISVVGAMAAIIGDPVQYEDLFDKAIEIAKKIRKNDQREKALGFVVHAMARCSLFSRGLDLAMSIIDKGIRNSALADTAEAQARTGQISEAIETATLHTDPGDDLVFEISASLVECTRISVSSQVEAVCQFFHMLGTRDADNFWQCFRAMLPVIEEVGEATLLADTWEQMQQVDSLLMREAEQL